MGRYVKGRTSYFPSIDNRLLAYTVAAGASLALASGAEAAIQYSAADFWVTSGSSFSLNPDGAGATNEFEFFLNDILNRRNASVVEGTASAEIAGAGLLLKNFAVGEWISSGETWFSGFGFGSLFVYTHPGGSTWNLKSGFFNQLSPGYMGVRFHDGSGLRYGWVHIDQIQANGASYHINGYAYEDTGLPILAGLGTGGDQGGGGGGCFVSGTTSEGEPQPPAAGGLALLALGAAGIAAYRRRKSDAE